MSSEPVQKELQNIISDKTSGSRELLSKLLFYLKNHREEINSRLISSLQSVFSDFQSIQDFLSKVNTALQENSLDTFLLEFDEQDIYEKIYKNLKPHIADINSILTISNSKTVLEVLKFIATENKSIKVFVSEGRPILEGIILAENLVSEKITTALITEAQIYNSIKQCDCGIIGADKVLSNGNVVNKVGSNLLALACREFNKPFFVMADKTKFSKDSAFDKKEMPPEEIYSGNENVKMSNYYFEEIPKEYITNIITD